MRDLAERLLPVYQEKDPDRYLANLSALQMAAGDYGSAYATRQSLRERRRSADQGRPVGRAVIYDIYAYAKATEAEKRVPFPQAFTQAFRDVVPRLNDQDAYAVTRWLGTSLPVFQESLQKAFDQQRVKDSVSEAEAVDLIWTYIGFEAYRTFGTLVDALDAEDDGRRYEVDENVVIKTAGGGRIHAVVVRPKSPSKPLPALLEFTIYDSQNDAKECAAHGFVGVVAYTRGRRQGIRSGSLSVRRRRCAGGDQLDRQAVLERRQGGHVRERLQRVCLLGRGEAHAQSPEGHRHFGSHRSGNRFPDVRQRFPEFGLSLVLVCDQSRSEGGRQVLRRRTVAGSRSEVVRQRPALPGSRPPAENAEPHIHPLAEPSEL